MQLSIHSIFRATEGEGQFIGTPQVFVRFQGCSIGCLNCDSVETWEFNSVAKMSMSEVMLKIAELSGDYGPRRVSITGGDPLHPSHLDAVLELITQCKIRGYFVNIEAYGPRMAHQIYSAVDFISMDLKTPSTGVSVNTSALFKIIEKYRDKIQIKAVIETEADFEYTYKVYQAYRDQNDANSLVPWCLTPAYNPTSAFPKKMFEEILNQNESLGGPFRVIGQQHKWVFGPDRRDV